MRERRVQTGVENLVGAAFQVVEPLMPDGQIRVLGELWEAHAQAELPRGTPVRVLRLEGLTLEVEATDTTSARGRSGRRRERVAGCGEGLRTAGTRGPLDAHTAPSTGATPSPLELLRSRSYVVLLVLGAIIGVPVAAAAYSSRVSPSCSSICSAPCPATSASKASLSGGRFRCLR